MSVLVSILFAHHPNIILHSFCSETSAGVRQLIWSDKDSRREHKPLPLHQQGRRPRCKGKTSVSLNRLCVYAIYCARWQGVEAMTKWSAHRTP